MIILSYIWQLFLLLNSVFGYSFIHLKNQLGARNNLCPCEQEANKFYQVEDLLIFYFCSFTDDECRNIIFKEPVANRAMKNHVIRSDEVPNEGTCRLLCYMEPNCVSINLGPSEDGKHKCDLNNSTVDNQKTIFLADEPSFTYLAIEVISYSLNL